MGVPAFFKWLSSRCPMIIQDAIEPVEGGGMAGLGEEIKENPTVDNLYLDMNGIIHPCCHPDGIVYLHHPIK